MEAVRNVANGANPNANGWLKRVDWNSSTVAEYAYDEVGNRTRVDLGNTTYTTYGYSTTDPRYFVGAIGHYDSSNALLNGAAITYTYRDDSGNPTEIQDWDPARTYDYDNNNRLTSAGGSSFGYDWVGNRLNPPANPSPMVYDATDKLVTWPGQHQYTYYPTGSLHQQKNSGGTVQKTFAYTGAELLSSVTHAGVANPSLMEWDADSNRVSFTSSTGGTTEFVYDTTAGIPAVLEEWDGEASVYYIREPGGELIARMAGASKQYYHFDELGSTRLLTNDSGTVTDTYTYDAWGKLTSHTRNTGSIDQPYMYVGRLGYYSHYQDENLFDDEYPTDPQFLQLGVRFYDALAGRFTQRDPIQSGMNWYVYVENLPVMASDPTGYATAWGWLRGQLYVDGSCSKMLDFLRRIFENDPSNKWRNVATDTWYAVDAVHCYSATKSGGSWSNVKIPDGAMCKVSCSRKGCAPNENWSIDLDCSRSRSTRVVGENFVRNDRRFPSPPVSPTMPSGVASVECNWSLK